MMNSMEVLEIISAAGQARNSYIEAIAEAKLKNYDKCNELMKRGNELYADGHRIHQSLVSQEAGGESVEVTLLLTHAQDQLMSAENFKIVCEELIDVYRKLDYLDKK